MYISHNLTKITNEVSLTFEGFMFSRESSY